jgi:hypothetical protein
MLPTTLRFDQRAEETLGAYVYALFDPRNSTLPFYVGKGRGNRVFDHAQGVIPDVDGLQQSSKLRLIRDIYASGLEVIHKILRFGMPDDEALRLEATLIDFINFIEPDRLTNEVSGQGVAEGFFDTRDLAISLAAEPLNSGQTKILLVKIERRWTALVESHGAGSAVPDKEVFEATRGDWKLSLDRARSVQYVLAVARGLVRGVYAPKLWGEAGYENRKRIVNIDESAALPSWTGRSVAHLFSRGSQNPLRYLPRDDA